MKFAKYFLSGLLISVLTLATGCQTDYDEPGLVDPKATMVPNTTISELKNMIKDKASMEIPMRDEAASQPYIISGYVISSDVTGNLFKQLMVQDETGAIQFSINRNNLYTDYRVGQKVVINVTGLWGGLYNNLVCIGWGANSYGSMVTSRMDWNIFRTHTQLEGLPDEGMKYIPYSSYPESVPENSPYTIVLPDLNLTSQGSDEFYALQCQLVEIPNVYFQGGGKEPYALKDENISRTLICNNGGNIDVRNSGMSTFYNTILPEGVGTIRGILSYYGSGWQLYIRDLNDVMFDGEGSKEKPYTIDEIIAMDNNGRSGWGCGYIVGSVKAGVSSVSSNADVIFGADADLDNTLVLAESADCTDVSQCVVVPLPAGSVMRKYLNLADNPGVYKKKLSVNGWFRQILGMHGITETKGGISDFVIYDYDIPGITDGGSGTSSDPYTVEFVINNPDEQSGVWVEGYIVGFVSGRDYFNGVIFSNDTEGADYGNNNVVIASSALVNVAEKAIPVRLTAADRQILGLGNAPGMLGKKVKFKGNIGTYLGAPGLPTTESSEIVD